MTKSDSKQFSKRTAPGDITLVASIKMRPIDSRLKKFVIKPKGARMPFRVFDWIGKRATSA
jgi:hypothetical protein